MPDPIRQNDTAPPFTAIASNKNGPLLLATRFMSVTFRMVGEGKIITGAATYDDAGNLTYQWQAGDTDTPGNYVITFLGVDDAGREQTIPTAGNIAATIIPRI